MVKGSGVTPEDSPMIRVPAQRGYPHKLKSGADAPDAIAVLTQALASQPDHSVVIVQVDSRPIWRGSLTVRERLSHAK